MDNTTVVCFRCKQAGHRKAECPHRQEPRAPATASAKAPAAQRTYKRTDLIECPVCARDWVAVFTKPAQPLFSTYCPWCRIFQIDDDGAVRRRELISQLSDITERYHELPPRPASTARTSTS